MEKWAIVCGSAILICISICMAIYNVAVEKTNQKALELGYIQEVSDYGKVIWVKADSVIVPFKAEGE